MKIPKIGKRGWLGVFICATGLLTIIGANSQAQTEIDQGNESLDERTYQNVVAHAAGHSSFKDALAEKNRNSGGFFMFVGAMLTLWGYKRYNGKSPGLEKKQTDKPAA